MKQKLTFCVALFLISAALTAQQSLSLNVGMDLAGLGFGYKFREGGNVLKRGGAGYYEANVAFYSKLRYRLGSYFGLEASYSLVEYDMGVHDVKYLKDNNLPAIDPGSGSGTNFEGQPGYLGAYKYYSSPGCGIYGFFPLYRKDQYSHAGSLSAYLTTGILFNTRKGASEYRNSYRNAAKNEELLLVTRYADYFNTYYCETGITYTSKVNFVCNVGLKYVFGSPMMEADYTDIANGTLISSDKVTANSSYFALTFTVGYNFWNRPKRNKYEKPILVQDVLDEPIDTVTYEKDVYSRPLEIANTMNVSGEKVKLIIWDDGTVDGDVISLNLNGNWILTEYTLTEEKYEISISLKPGDNKLVLYTESEGRHKPCTAAIKVVDNKIVQWVVLKSDLKKSSCLILKSGE